MEPVTRRLGSRWNDTIDQIYQAFLAQVNCNPGGALLYVNLLRELEEGDLLDWDEMAIFRKTLAMNPPHAGLLKGQ